MDPEIHNSNTRRFRGPRLKAQPGTAALDIARALLRLEAYQEMTQRWGWTEQEWIELMTGVWGYPSNRSEHHILW